MLCSQAAKKGQVMPEFLVEIQSFSTESEQLLLKEQEFQTWVLCTYGASNPTSAGIGIV